MWLILGPRQILVVFESLSMIVVVSFGEFSLALTHGTARVLATTTRQVALREGCDAPSRKALPAAAAQLIELKVPDFDVWSDTEQHSSSAKWISLFVRDLAGKTICFWLLGGWVGFGQSARRGGLTCCCTVSP